MSPQRLSALDASFLAVESPSAHMHVGWAATFAAPEHGPRPGFGELFAHIAGRLGRAPRYRQRVAPDALGLHAPLWVDAEDFDPAEHIHHSAAERLEDLADAVLSEPLRRDRPLWEFWIAPELADGRIGLVGKVHHCMVDGLAAVELGMLLLDFEPEPSAVEADEWLPAPAPHALELLARGAWDRTREPLGAAEGAARARARAARAAALRAPDRPRAGRRRAPGRPAEPAQRARARPTATSPPRGARSTSCARSRTTTA